MTPPDAPDAVPRYTVCLQGVLIDKDMNVPVAGSVFVAESDHDRLVAGHEKEMEALVTDYELQINTLVREREDLRAQLQAAEGELRQYKAQPIDLKQVREETLRDSSKEELYDWCLFFMRKRTDLEQRLAAAQQHIAVLEEEKRLRDSILPKQHLD